MQAFRRLIDPHPGWWLRFCLVVLALRLLVPAGYMPVVDTGGIAIVSCPDGAAPASSARAAHADRHGSGDHDNRDAHHGAGQVCAFAGVSAPLLAGADPVLLAAALA